MSRSRRQAAANANASKRGRHKRRSSPETLTWEREHLLPKRPAWMTDETYLRLAELRAEL